jgi:hypothetical protein
MDAFSPKQPPAAIIAALGCDAERIEPPAAKVIRRFAGTGPDAQVCQNF